MTSRPPNAVTRGQRVPLAEVSLKPEFPKVEHTSPTAACTRLVCSDPYCRQAAEWRLPPGASRRNPNQELFFCFACLDRLCGMIRKSDGEYAAETLKRSVCSVSIAARGREALDPGDFLAELIVKFERQGKSIREAVNLARAAVRELERTS